MDARTHPARPVMDVSVEPRSPASWAPRGLTTAIPSWIVSAVIHGALLVLFTLFLRPVVPRGSASDEFRTVGIFTRGDAPESGSVSTDNGTAAAEIPAAESEQSLQSTTDRSPVDDAPPLPLELPRMTEPGIGPATGGASAARGTDARDLVRGAPGRGTGAGGPGQGEGRVAFFGSGQVGQRFVFVLDASGSMYEHGAIQVAKAELLASINQIADEQEFQIVFYNDQIFPMPTTGQRTALFRGTEANRNLANQHVRSVQPAGGTQHKEALLEALKFRPDVIFFLTDAGEPWVDAKDLAEIRKRNAGRCRICVVEFGKGASLAGADAFWTRKLARDNDGTYAYHDTQNFQRKR